MDQVLHWLGRYQYLAMFGILVLCGLGLPVPEEVTLIGSGFVVQWHSDPDHVWASYMLATLACTVGILVGDSIIFFIGRRYGRQFFGNRIVRWMLPRRRQARVRREFSRHGKKTVFFARFVAGIRIGVYAYAGQHGMRWPQFLFLDFLGCLVSVPTSIWIGKFVAGKVADPAEAQEYAQKILREGHAWLYWALGLMALFVLFHVLWGRWRDRRSDEREGSQRDAQAASKRAT